MADDPRAAGAGGDANGGANNDGDGEQRDAQFANDLERFTAWWTAPHSLTRHDAALGTTTVTEHAQWARRYRAYEGARAASVRDLVADIACFIRFLDSHQDKSAGSRASYCNSMLSLLKYAHAPFSEADPPREIVLVRNQRSQLQSAYVVDLRSR